MRLSVEEIEHLNVRCNDVLVGQLAYFDRYRTAFQYDQEWLKNGYPISPFSLPLEDKVFIAEPDPFNGLFGVFSDSLPDGWGRLLVDRIISKKGESCQIRNT